MNLQVSLNRNLTAFVQRRAVQMKCVPAAYVRHLIMAAYMEELAEQHGSPPPGLYEEE